MTTSAVAPTNGDAPSKSLNPFSDRPDKSKPHALVEAESQRAIAEIQGAMVIAQRFPRNEKAVVDAILNAFTRVELCEKAMYEYARGGTDVSGLSIRAAEAIFQQWGNVRCGVRELEQRSGSSTVQSYAWDLQTNVLEERTFHVEHIRETKTRTYRLEDSRDIYELTANMGARRLRACILALIPIDVQKAVEKQVELTLTNKIKVTPERITSLVEMFAEFGVTKRNLENLIQRHLDSVTPLQVLRFGRIYTAIKDGVAEPKDFFDIEPAVAPAEGNGDKTRTDVLADRLKNKNAGAAVPPEETPPEHVEAQKPTDEKQRRNELRIEIDRSWQHVSPALKEAVLTREYARKTTLDLTTDQLSDFLARTPELLPRTTAE